MISYDSSGERQRDEETEEEEKNEMNADNWRKKRKREGKVERGGVKKLKDEEKLKGRNEVKSILQKEEAEEVKRGERYVASEELWG